MKMSLVGAERIRVVPLLRVLSSPSWDRSRHCACRPAIVLIRRQPAAPAIVTRLDTGAAASGTSHPAAATVMIKHPGRACEWAPEERVCVNREELMIEAYRGHGKD